MSKVSLSSCVLFPPPPPLCLDPTSKLQRPYLGVEAVFDAAAAWLNGDPTALTHRMRSHLCTCKCAPILHTGLAVLLKKKLLYSSFV